MREVFKLTRHANHKLDKIELILGFYPDMQFVLIGDSGEQDPEIYAEVVRRHPKSVRMIYIRNVNPDPSRIDALDRLIEEVSATGIQLVLAAGQRVRGVARGGGRLDPGRSAGIDPAGQERGRQRTAGGLSACVKRSLRAPSRVKPARRRASMLNGPFRTGAS